MATAFDYIVIGGGSGGIASANRAAMYGAKVLVIEQDRLGGTCVNRGCVPKKVMWYAASVAENLREANAYGFNVGETQFDWNTLVEKREAYVHRLNDAYASRFATNNITTVFGHGQFIDEHTVEVNGERFTAPHILIAVGGYPSVPPIAGAELGITSDGFFTLKQQPKKVLVVGSGYIAVELAGLLNSLGTEVTMLIRGHCVLRNFDRPTANKLMEQMQQHGVKFISKQNPVRVTQEQDGLCVHCEASSVSIVQSECCEDEQAVDQAITAGGFDHIIWAIGRSANTIDLGLDKTGISTNNWGFIETDAYQNTPVKGIYAVGDITGQAALTPVAVAAGRRLARRLFNNEQQLQLDYSQIPSVVFSHPPLASVGLTERQARATYGDKAVKVYQSEFNPMYYALSSHKVPTLMRLICAGDDEKVVGCHILGRDADEILQGFAAAIKMGASKADFDNTIAIHPTSGEELVTLT